MPDTPNHEPEQRPAPDEASEHGPEESGEPATELREPAEARGEESPWAARMDLAVGLLALLALVVHPTQITIHQWVRLTLGEGLARLVPRQNVTPADALFLLAFALWVVRAVLRRDWWPRARRYPVALLVLFGAALASVGAALAGGAGADALKSGLKEAVQLVILLVCAFCVLADYLQDRKWRRRLVFGFLAASVAGLAWGVVEYSRLRPGDVEAAKQGYTVSPTEVDGPFGLRRGQEPGEKGMVPTASNRNVLGSWVTLVVPLLAGLALWGTCPWLRVLCGVAALAGLPLLLTGGLWAAGVLALLVVAVVRSRWLFPAVAAAVVVMFVLLPDWHGAVLMDSVMLRRGGDPFFTLRLYGDRATHHAAEGGRPSSLNYGDWAEPRELSKWQEKWFEWQAGAKAAADRPLLGAGLGTYQHSVGNYYQGPELQESIDPDRVYELAKPPRNLKEFGANSTYLVWLVTTGFGGVLALLWVLMTGLQWGARAMQRLVGYERALALGAVGALGASCFGMLFADYFVRGVGIAFVFPLALCAALARQAETETMNDVHVDVEPRRVES